MKEYKRLKDPIYGYISIPTQYMNGIIDTACFQRLRRIIQTSYSPLYSSAVHNRFVHSMGVFHLGEIASTQVITEIEKKYKFEFDVKRIGEIFMIACLLHDVGHAPFSHTGEDFYLDDDKKFTGIHDKLIEVVSVEKFAEDVPQEKTAAAAPHEIMSSIVGIISFANFFLNDSEREFFARCITGYKYSKKSDENDIRNCFIQLLNSKVIDVDKLDYLIRDAYITGFDTVSIDYERLLGALTIVKTDSGYELAYYKNAISVIENVVYAHDAERKWIQNHPIVIYETYILQHIIGHLCTQIHALGKKLFCLEFLQDAGQEFQENVKVSLMSDDDIVYLMKNVFPNELSAEYFRRIDRRHPVWKSEAEYKTFFLGKTSGGEILKEFEVAMAATAKYLGGRSDIWTINQRLVDVIQTELSEIDKQDLDDMSKTIQKKDKEKILKVVNCLQKYASEKSMKCDFIIIKATQFNSGFGKPDFSETNISFPTGDGEEKIAKVGEIVSSLNAKSKDRDDFFYLFYKRDDNTDIELESQELCRVLIREFV
ncbi:MAG: HD domain-containing protein [Lachnospiraceae bacterium]|nr:HD domain-containing protein [Lachnospiraceae bacterium]